MALATAAGHSQGPRMARATVQNEVEVTVAVRAAPARIRAAATAETAVEAKVATQGAPAAEVATSLTHPHRKAALRRPVKARLSLRCMPVVPICGKVRRTFPCTNHAQPIR